MEAIFKDLDVSHSLKRDLFIQAPLNNKLFPVYRPTELKGADFCLNFFRKFVSFIYILYIPVKKKMEANKSRPPNWPFVLPLGGQETLFYLRVASLVSYFYVFVCFYFYVGAITLMVSY